MKKLLLIFVALILVGFGGAYFFITNNAGEENINTVQGNQTDTQKGDSLTITADATTKPNTDASGSKQFTIGSSVEGRPIKVFSFGTGEKNILFIAGVHGGYEWNTVLGARKLIEYFRINPDAIPKNITVTIIPVLNPDGLYKTVGTTEYFTPADIPTNGTKVTQGRFNARGVDLNRNFDCQWQPTGKWQNKTVDAGVSAFSEPESKAIQAYITANTPTAVMVWYSAANGVFASSCGSAVLPETTTLTNLFAKASGYKAYQKFDYYKITGDMVNWFAKEKIPAISVLLSTHTATDWNENIKGILAILQHYAK